MLRGWTTKSLGLCVLILSLVITGTAPTPFGSVARVSAEPTVPYDLGNCTYVSKPVLPVRINASQIPIGSDWTYVYPLEAGSAYRVYCYGDWIDSSADTYKTDYDIFVYNPSGELESYHTESAGLPEHLGTTVNHPFFIPQQTGNYSFRIRNDARESNGSDAATFMIIEHIDTGIWYSRYMEGKVDDKPVEKTTWAYEFNTSSSQIEVCVDVPDTLDMYEARLYIMTNPAEEGDNLLNGVPLAWEPGLYGNTSEIYGGYNLDSEGFRCIEAMASCEYPGEDMHINFTAPAKGNLLYHLAFIAENGNGTINFMVKTDFDAPQLTILDPIEKMSPNNQTSIIAHIEEQCILETVTLNYTTDDWQTSASLEMVETQNRTYNATVPGQPAGTAVNYTVLACDTSGNSAQVFGFYDVKNFANLSLELSTSSVYVGENITVTGSLPVSETNVTVHYGRLDSDALNGTTLDSVVANGSILNYTSKDSSASKLVSTDSSGEFMNAHSVNKNGTWIVWADWNGSETYFPAISSCLNFTANKRYISLLCNVTSRSLTIGENVTVVGQVYPRTENLTVSVVFIGSNSTVKQTACTDVNGTYVLSWKPDALGLWQINAQIDEDASRNEAYSNTMTFTVNDTFLNQYLIIILGAVGGVAGVIVVVFIIKKRREE